jgi:hypothetical protein
MSRLGLGHEPMDAAQGRRPLGRLGFAIEGVAPYCRVELPAYQDAVLALVEPPSHPLAPGPILHLAPSAARDVDVELRTGQAQCGDGDGFLARGYAARLNCRLSSQAFRPAAPDEHDGGDQQHENAEGRQYRLTADGSWSPDWWCSAAAKAR